MWAAKHCSILFSSVLHQPERFYACNYHSVSILNVIKIVFDSRMLRSNICESLWLLECGAVKQWEMTSQLCAHCLLSEPEIGLEHAFVLLIW